MKKTLQSFEAPVFIDQSKQRNVQEDVKIGGCTSPLLQRRIIFYFSQHFWDTIPFFFFTPKQNISAHIFKLCHLFL